jgi:hypothetical protein
MIINSNLPLQLFPFISVDLDAKCSKPSNVRAGTKSLRTLLRRKSSTSCRRHSATHGTWRLGEG